MKANLQLVVVVLLLVSASMVDARTMHRSTTPAHRASYCKSCARDHRGHIQRSSSVRRRFLRSKGLTHTPADCQVDHTVALARGGKDSIANLQLLCGDALKRKEESELK